MASTQTGAAMAWLRATAIMLIILPVAVREGRADEPAFDRYERSGAAGVPSREPAASLTTRIAPSQPQLALERKVRLDRRSDGQRVAQHVLMSRSPDDLRDYPSPYQVGEGTVVITGRLEGMTEWRGSGEVFLRVAGTNEKGSGPAAVLRGPGCEALGSVQSVYRVTTDLDGAFRVEASFVVGGGRAPSAGDTFVIEASIDPSFDCQEGCPSSEVFQLWKRVYVELDEMYRSGATIELESRGDARRIAVDDVRPFRKARPDRPIEVRLMHSGQSGDGAGAGSHLRYEEVNHVVGIVRPDRRQESGFVELLHPLRERRYGPGDAIVVPCDGVFEKPSLDAVKKVFAEAFVEIVELENAHAFVPHRRFAVEELGEDFNAFAQRWSDYGSSSTFSARNTVMIVAADHKTQVMPGGRMVMHPAIGSCNVRPARVNNVFLWRGAVESQVRLNEAGIGIGGHVPGDVMNELVVHELAHTFGVQDCEACGRTPNREGTGLSTMHVPVGPEMGDGVWGFHDEAYRTIASAVDPLPQG